jgi:hypothetical protein
MSQIRELLAELRELTEIEMTTDAMRVGGCVGFLKGLKRQIELLIKFPEHYRREQDLAELPKQIDDFLSELKRTESVGRFKQGMHQPPPMFHQAGQPGLTGEE